MLTGAIKLCGTARQDMQNNSFTRLVVIVGFQLGTHLGC